MVHLLKQDETSATLIEAALNGNVRSVELLIAAGAQVNYQVEVRFTACMHACLLVKMVGRHCTWPVRRVICTMELLECC